MLHNQIAYNTKLKLLPTTFKHIVKPINSFG